MGKSKKSSKGSKKDQPTGQGKNVSSRAPVLPPVLEVSMTFSRLLVLSTGLATALLSTLAGAALWVTVLRSAAAILSLGLMLWFANWLLARYTMERLLSDINQKSIHASNLTTIEKRA